MVTLTDYEADALAFARYNALANGCERAIIRHLDWNHPTLTQRYPLLIASDVLYERAAFQPLLQLCQAALEPHGRVILAEPNRPIAVDFLRLLRDHGFRYARITERVEVHGQPYDISIYDGSRRTTIRRGVSPAFVNGVTPPASGNVG
jgi:23S rRNA G2069 N7-methylase RlmK/C1962 C5-methylase RlmI